MMCVSSCPLCFTTKHDNTVLFAWQLQEIRDYKRNTVPLGVQQMQHQEAEEDSEADDDVTEDEEVHRTSLLSA